MKIFSKIREIVWPILERDSIQEPKLLNENEITIDSSRFHEIFDHVFNCYKEEEERRKTIESKSSLFIGTISVVGSIIIGATSVFTKDVEFNILILVVVILLFILTLYITRTIWFSIKALERKNYDSISPDDFFKNRSENDYYKQLIIEITNKINKNAFINNGKVDNMTMAQEYFKRAIFVVASYSLVILLLFLFKYNLDLLNLLNKFIELLNNIHINGWNTLILYMLSISSVIISIIAIKRKK
jgi:hypothetical protein